jgi:hypothetical protein
MIGTTRRASFANVDRQLATILGQQELGGDEVCGRWRALFVSLNRLPARRELGSPRRNSATACERRGMASAVLPAVPRQDRL